MAIIAYPAFSGSQKLDSFGLFLCISPKAKSRVVPGSNPLACSTVAVVVATLDQQDEMRERRRSRVERRAGEV